MKKVLFVLIMLFAINVYAGEKIYVVDTARILKESDAGKIAINAIEKLRSEYISDLKTKAEELSILEKDKSKADDYRKKAYEHQALNKYYDDELKRIDREYASTIYKDIKDIIKSIQKTKGFIIVVDKSYTLYGTDSCDLTSEVIRKYNNKLKK